MSQPVRDLLAAFHSLSPDDQRQFVHLFIGTSSSSTVYHVQRAMEAHHLQPANLFQILPLEISLRILEFVTLQDLASLSRTCHTLKSLVQDSSLWRKLYVRILGKTVRETEGLGPLRLRFKQEYGLHNNWRRGAPAAVRDLECPKPRGMAVLDSRLLLAFYEGNIEERSLETLQVTRKYAAGHCVACMDVNFAQEEMAVGTFVKMTKVIDLKGNLVKRSYTGHFGPVFCLALNSAYLASSSSDHLLLIVDRQTEESNALFAHNKKITALRMLSETRLASGSEDGKLVIWNLQTMDTERVLQLDGEPEITDILFVAGNVFVSSSSVLAIFSAQDFSLVGQFDLPAASLATAHGLVIVAGEHLNPVTLSTFRLRPCLCCHTSHNSVAMRPRNFTLVRASERFLVASNQSQTVVYDFAPR